MEVNYLGSYAVAQAFLPLLLKTAPKRSSMERPSIIMVNSFNSQVPALLICFHVGLTHFNYARHTCIEPLHGNVLRIAVQ